MNPERDSSLDRWQNDVACELLARPKAAVVRAVLQRIANGVSLNAVRVLVDRSANRTTVSRTAPGSTTLSIPSTTLALAEAQAAARELECSDDLSPLTRSTHNIDITVSRMRQHERPLAIALHRAFPHEALPIVDGLLTDVYRETRGIDDEATPALIDRAFEEGSVKAAEVRSALKMLLRDRLPVKGENNERVSRSLEAVKRLASNSPRARAQWLRRAQEHALGNVVTLADAMLEDAWKMFLTVPAVTADESKRISLDETAHMSSPGVGAPTIRDAANCDRHAEGMKSLRSPHEWIALLAKQMAVIMDMFATAIRFPYAEQLPTNPRQSCHATGTPVAFERDRRFTCFTGPWMTGALLLASGFKEEELFYANRLTPDAHDTRDGAHGMLFALNAAHELIKIDLATYDAGSPLTNTFLDPRTVKRVRTFLGAKPNERERVIPIRLDRARAAEASLPSHFQLLPLRAGIASGYYLHTGIEFYTQGKYEEAEVALRLSLNHNPENADTLYYLGLIAWKNGHVDQSEADLLESLRIAPARVWTQFSYGQFLLRERGDTQGAIFYLQKVVLATHMPWGDYSCVAKAKRILVSLGVEIPKTETKMSEQETKSDDGKKQ